MLGSIFVINKKVPDVCTHTHKHILKDTHTHTQTHTQRHTQTDSPVDGQPRGEWSLTAPGSPHRPAKGQSVSVPE